MSVYNFHWNDPLPVPCQQGAVTIGNFDGVHRGHQALLTELRRQAAELPGPAVVLTFDPHPLQLLRPQAFPPLLTTMPQRAELLRQYGADHVLILQTTQELLNLHAREFFDRVIRDHLHPRIVVPGFNFAFGKDREGTVEKLREFCQQASMIFDLVPPLQLEAASISSSRIRTALQQGAIRSATALLGRPYQLTGKVSAGQHRGQTLGFPTANLEDVATLVPANGVYAVRVHVQDQSWPGAANIGPNPTFGEQARKIEVHLIGYEGNLYGATVAIDFIDRLRETKPFAGIEQLREQLTRDVEQAKTMVQEAE